VFTDLYPAEFGRSLADIRQDPAVVDLLLVMVAAMAGTSNLNLLSDYPISDAEGLLYQEVPYLDSTLLSHGRRSHDPAQLGL
jgi:hypothetical protein